MCEPSHSIVQYMEDTDKNYNQFAGLKLRKIHEFYHLSTPGHGHSEALILCGINLDRECRMPTPIYYEGIWWDREVQLDSLWLRDCVSTESYEAAQAYDRETVTGSMRKFRQFIELSIDRSSQPQYYLDRLLHYVLTPKARDSIIKKYTFVTGKNKGYSLRRDDIPMVTKMILGATRNRKNLSPAFADDETLWRKRGEPMVV